MKVCRQCKKFDSYTTAMMNVCLPSGVVTVT